MLSRKEQNSSGTPFPENWSSEVLNLLTSVYEHPLKTKNRFFEFHGLIYPDELFLGLSIMNSKNRSISPVSIMLSTDIKNSNNLKKMIDTLIDGIGFFLDQYFKQEDWEEWQPLWQEEDFKNINFYYKISREDLTLTLEADKLLE